ncbi:MAG: hypothetical protein KBS35_02285 [Mycoplasma sp.]|nr:hypothetical protein [Candidatus Hennigella equi]
MGNGEDKLTPILIDKNLWQDFEDLCDDEDLTFEEGIETLIEQAIDNWQITQWYDDEEKIIINDWKDIKENERE